MALDLGPVSPALLKKIVYAGSNTSSFQRGAKDLLVLAEVRVEVKQVERLTRMIGQERLAERQTATQTWLDRPLTQREDLPPQVTAPALAVVEMDGGRLQIRPQRVTLEQTEPPHREPANASQEQTQIGPSPQKEPAENPPEAPPPEPPTLPASILAAGDEGTEVSARVEEPQEATERRVKSKHWREDKVGCLLEMSSEVHQVDPCPEIPATFVDPLRTLVLAQEIGHCAVPKGMPFQQPQPATQQADEATSPSRPGKPEIVCRRVVASRQDVDGFGPLLAAAAWSMGLFAASRRAFVADGSSTNWSVWKRYFARWVGVLDFVHALSYVYGAAMAGRSFAVGWPVYERWIRWVWGGEVGRVIEELRARQQELGEATREDKEGSPRRVLQEALTYLSNNQDKMAYDEYRKEGLPLMSSHVESVIKQINYRVKGTEKFWSEAGAEAILQLRADYLSDDEPLEGFWQRRQAAATGQRRYRRSA